MSWYKDEINLKIIGMLGGCIVVLSGAFWTVYTYFKPQPDPRVQDKFNPLNSNSINQVVKVVNSYQKLADLDSPLFYLNWDEESCELHMAVLSREKSYIYYLEASDLKAERLNTHDVQLDLSWGDKLEVYYTQPRPAYDIAEGIKNWDIPSHCLEPPMEKVEMEAKNEVIVVTAAKLIGEMAEQKKREEERILEYLRVNGEWPNP